MFDTWNETLIVRSACSLMFRCTLALKFFDPGPTTMFLGELPNAPADGMEKAAVLKK